MTINQTRSALYAAAKALGDIQALKSKKPGAIRRRIARRLWGWLLGRFAFRWTGSV